MSLRIVRICTKPESRDLRLAELKVLLLAREYPESLVNRSIEKAENIPRKVALLNVRPKITERRKKIVTKYYPRMPKMQQMLAKHYIYSVVIHIIQTIYFKSIIRI